MFPRVIVPGGLTSIAVDSDYGFGKGLRRLLRKIVPDTAFDDLVRVFA
jgi:hypothetical protein